MNVELLNQRLRQYEEGAKASEFAKLLWRPKEGSQFVRIVPYKFNPDNPLIELKFYYKIGGNNYLAPCTFGKPDPILEIIDTLRYSGNIKEKETAQKLAPVARIYAPVIVRGEEEKGVRFWGFGVQVHKKLLGLMTKQQMWGDITSLTDGNDLEVVFHKVSAKKNMKTGQPFPETEVTPCPQKTPVVDPTRRDLLDLIKNQTDILTIFPLRSYDELKKAITIYLNPEQPVDDPDIDDITPQTPTATAAAVNAPTTPQAARLPVVQSNEALATELDQFFKK